MLKFLQQVCAAHQAGVSKLHYSTFRNQELCDTLTRVLTSLVERDITIAQIVSLMVEFGTMRSHMSFADFIFNKIGVA